MEESSTHFQAHVYFFSAHSGRAGAIAPGESICPARARPWLPLLALKAMKQERFHQANRTLLLQLHQNVLVDTEVFSMVGDCVGLLFFKAKY